MARSSITAAEVERLRAVERDATRLMQHLETRMPKAHKKVMEDLGLALLPKPREPTAFDVITKVLENYLPNNRAASIAAATSIRNALRRAGMLKHD